jgi:hypothetical protein
VELDDLRAGVETRGVARRGEVRVARLVRLLVAVGEREGHAPLDDVAPVRALAAVVRKSLEQRRQIGVRGVCLESDRVATVEVLEVALVAVELERLRRAVSLDAFGIAVSSGVECEVVGRNAVRRLPTRAPR